jgi:hypothetical protein
MKAVWKGSGYIEIFFKDEKKEEYPLAKMYYGLDYTFIKIECVSEVLPQISERCNRCNYIGAHSLKIGPVDTLVIRAAYRISKSLKMKMNFFKEKDMRQFSKKYFDCDPGPSSKRIR